MRLIWYDKHQKKIEIHNKKCEDYSNDIKQLNEDIEFHNKKVIDTSIDIACFPFPKAGIVKSLAEIISGKNLITGEELSNIDKGQKIGETIIGKYKPNLGNFFSLKNIYQGISDNYKSKKDIDKRIEELNNIGEMLIKEKEEIEEEEKNF